MEKTKLHLHSSLLLLLLSLGATLHSLPPLLLLVVAFLPPLLRLVLSSCNPTPGGFAWRRETLPGGSPTPPGPAGHPFLGSLLTMLHPNPHRKLAELSSSSPGTTRLMSLSFGPTRVVISSHPDTAREILSGASFADRPSKLSARLLMFDRAIGFAPSGEYWRHLRHLAARHLFSPRAIASSESHRSNIAREILTRIENAMETKGEIELRKVLHWGSLESIITSVLGESTAASEREEMTRMVREGYDLITAFNLEDHVPLGGLLDFHGINRRCRNLAGRVRSLVGVMIEKRKVMMEEEKKKGQDDFLSALISAGLRESDVTSVAWEMIFRGADVVAILLEWAMARMVVHQDVQARVREEIRAVVGPDGAEVRERDVGKLRYLQAVVKEVLRVHPPGPLLSWARVAVRDVVVDKMFVPAGTTAMVNMWAITHDGSVWEDPGAFRPERFVMGGEEVSVMGSDLRLAPFGSGRRVCPGRVLGLATVHLWLANLLHHHSWLPAEKPVQLAERLRLSLEMKKPLVCRAVVPPTP